MLKLSVFLSLALPLVAFGQEPDPMPWLKGNVIPSVNAVRVLEKVKEARQEGKDLLLLSTAAWCPACAVASQAFSAKTDAVAKLKETVKVVMVEDENLATGLDDSFPAVVTLLPTFFYYDRAGNFWSPVAANDWDHLVESIQKDIDETRSVRGARAAAFRTKLDEKIANGAVFTAPDDEKAEDPTVDLLYSIRHELFELSGSALRARMLELMKLFSAKPEKFPFVTDAQDSIRYYINSALRTIVTKGLASTEELFALAPYFKESYTGSTEKTYAALKMDLMGVRSREGLPAAARICTERAEKAFGGFKPEEKGLAKWVYIAAGVCKLLNAQAGIGSMAEVIAHVATADAVLSKEDKASSLTSLIRISVTAGDFEFGYKNVDTLINDDTAAHSKRVTDLMTKQKDAEKAGDAEKAKKLGAQIEMEKFRFQRVLGNYELQKAAWKEGRPAEIAFDM